MTRHGTPDRFACRTTFEPGTAARLLRGRLVSLGSLAARAGRSTALLAILSGVLACGGAAPASPLGHRFARAEDWAARFEGKGRDDWQKPGEVIRLMTIEPGMTVADIGAGTGYFLPHLSSAVGDQGRVLALDIEPDMVRYIKERAQREKLGNVEPRVVAVDDPGLAPATVDRIVTMNTWHHIPDRAAYAAKLKTALVPGGAAFIVDFTLQSPIGPPRDHRLPPEQALDELTRGGLKASILAESLPHQYILVGRKLE